VLARRARTTATEESRRALAAFCEASWPTVRACVRRHGYRGADADDLTQAYFARFLERGDLEYAASWQGCVSGFLRVSVRYFLANERDRERARKRGGGVRPLSLDTPHGEQGAVPEPACDETPETLLVRARADATIRRALEQLRADMQRVGGAERLARVEGYLLAEVNTGSYGRMAREWGVGESAARVLIHRLRRRLTNLLRASVGPPSPLQTRYPS
jgi:RNA polymerase sigma-70 factor (ECF subfamily)